MGKEKKLLTSREIKFRAWDWDESKMFSLLDFFQWNKYQPILYASDDIVWKWNIHFMQYTWLKDKNWKEIYEGDIYKAEWMSRENPKEKTKWKYFIVENMVDFLMDFCWWYEWTPPSHIEIIWNVFENPELLEATNDTTS